MIESATHADPALERHVRFQGASNFRDLGGYRTQDGYQVRWRRLFRSDRLSGLTPEDFQAFATLGVGHSIDFRGDIERRAHDYRIDALQRIDIPIEPKVVQSLQGLLATGDVLDAATTHRLMEETYVGFVRHNAPQYRQFFDILLTHETPILFHCTAGKDRTGFAAALLLELLGVRRDTILHDYLLTNELYQHPHLPSSTLPEEVLNVLWRVHPDFLHAAYREIDTHYGSVQDYAVQGLGLSPAAQALLRQRYLQPAP